MSHTTPAVLGGPPIRTKPLRPWNTIGAEEIAGVTRVLKTGVLSGYVGTWSDAFLGGPEVRALEQEWAQYFGCRHAIAVNSATSGLYAAIGALGIGPGDEVIVSPCSMSASATAPLIYGAIPVFADVETETYTLDPTSVEQAITPRTKAILTVNLFGHPSRFAELQAIAARHQVALIEDNAQAPGAVWHGRYTGTIGGIGVFSLNCHKHIQTGEGGICTTNDDRLADRLRLIRNHAEAVVEEKGETDLTNLIGWNTRMTETTAALARPQLLKLPFVLEQKVRAAETLREQLQHLPGVRPPHVAADCRHVYYTFPLQLEIERLEISRERFVAAVQAEGIPIVPRYVKPLYLAPLFQRRIAMGAGGFPFSADPTTAGRYQPGCCPIAERLYTHTLCYLPWCAYDFDAEAVRDVVRALDKVIAQRDRLREPPHG